MRIQGRCGGDCGKCELQANGEVDMIPCAIDQMFQRVQRMDEALREIREELRGRRELKLIEGGEVE